MGILDAVRDLRTIKQLMTRAEAEARSEGERVPGAEHLLLAATTLRDGSAVRALERVGATPQRLREALEETHRGALAAVGVDAEAMRGEPGLQGAPGGPLGSTPQAQQVFQEAVALSKSRRPSLLQGADVVAAVCSLERGTAARTLARLGVDRERLRAAALAEAGLSGR